MTGRPALTRTTLSRTTLSRTVRTGMAGVAGLLTLAAAACGGPSAASTASAAATPVLRTASTAGATATTPAPTIITATTTATATTAPGAITLPPVNGRFDYQIGGAYPPAATVKIVDRDRTAKPVPGKYNICYVNAFQSQAGEAAFWTGKHPDLLLKKSAGKYISDPGWPGEYILNTSTAAKRAGIAAIVGGWIDGCHSSGFQAVEPDNLDSWTRSKGRLTKADNVALATLLAERAHADALAIAQKNTTELGSTGKTKVGFDFAIAEECQVYSECDSYTGPYGRHVIEIEYTDNPARFYPAACAARGHDISIILRDRDVVAKGDHAYRYQNC